MNLPTNPVMFNYYNANMIQEIMLFVHRHPILSILWICLLLAVIILTFQCFLSKTKPITSAQAIQLFNQEEAIFIDLRSSNDFIQGHILNSINIDPINIKNNNIECLKQYKHKPIIAVSTNGIEAYKPAEKLVQYGFERVFILTEGMIGWSSENLPLVRGKK